MYADIFLVVIKLFIIFIVKILDINRESLITKQDVTQFLLYSKKNLYFKFYILYNKFVS